jgi:drug/metabolite transporter (DMT)-like permease
VELPDDEEKKMSDATGTTVWARLGGVSVGAQYLGAAAVWGASFLFIKVAVGGLSPVQVVWGRLVTGAAVLALIMLISGRRWPRGLTVWGHLAAIGALMCVAPFLLFSWAAQYLPSGMSSIYNATTPIATMLVALAVLPEEKLTRLRTAAIVVAAGGIVLVLAPWNLAGAYSPEFLVAQFACLGGTMCYGFGFTYTRRFHRDHDYDATTVAASQIGAAALIMMAMTPMVISSGPITGTPEIIASILLLGGLGTGLAYIWYNNVINAWGATIASTVTYLTPIGGVALGLLVLSESMHWNEILGAVIVILAILVSQGRIRVSQGTLASLRSRKRTLPPLRQPQN